MGAKRKRTWVATPVDVLLGIGWFSLGEMIVVGLFGVIVVAGAVTTVALRCLEVEIARLRARAAKLVRLSVAVDDLHHETTQVVPAYRDAVTRVRTLRRTEDDEGSR